jgi:hypothetical protein
MARWRRDYEGERRTERVTVQLTPSERATAEQRAARAQRRLLSDYFRRCALDGPEPVSAVDSDALHRIEAELRRVGCNLNQVAHHVNATGNLRSQAELDRCISELKIAFARVIAL